MISRATVYNTLNLFVERQLLRELYIAEGVVVFDPKLETHHHFVDDATGRIHDVPWERVQVCNVETLARERAKAERQVGPSATHRRRRAHPRREAGPRLRRVMSKSHGRRR